jgi:tetratricopeptide (TPR) repeat protein
MRIAGSLLFTTALVSQPALAGDEVLYDDPPAWVEQKPIQTEGRDPGSPIVLIDHQARIESGQLWTYIDTAVALDSPQALTQFGTLSANWMPDKGDLIVHSAELIRGNEVIDLLADNQQFEILRREQGLEARLLSGALTATMTVPGARLGDVVRLAYSTTLSDQAMGENVQWQSGLVADPFPLVDGRVRVSWPQDLPVTRLHTGNAAVGNPEVVDGFNVWTVDLPVEELEPFPYDAPARYQIGELLQVTTYRDWQAVSSDMAKHYGVAGTITPGGELAGEVARIRAASSDQLTRAALALQLVQDDISYLLNGLDGGNYLPQSPEETWENRFGDCKAKSVLLLAILQELGITSEAVLVRSQGGDVLPVLAPMPGNFDHVIVRAEIDGRNLWLDGTSTGARIDTIDTVPRFFYALPLREEGAELIKLDERAQSTPDRVVRLKVDQSAGVRLPALFEIEIEFRGTIGGQWRAFADQGDGEMRDNAVYSAVSSVVGQAQLIDEHMSYDVESGVALVTARGALPSPWERDDIEYELNAPSQAARAIAFSADRARADWRDIPLRLNGPTYVTSEFEITLPGGDQAFELKGDEQASAEIGGVEVSSTASLTGNRFTLSQSMRSRSEELASDQIPVARRALARFNRSLPVLHSAGGVRELWEYFGEDRELLAPFEAIYADAIVDAASDDIGPLLNRAGFRMSVYDHKGALEDVEAALAIEASRDLYLTRGYLRRELGDLEGALADYQLAEDLAPDGSTYSEQVELLALLGETEEGLALAEEYQDFADDPVAETNLLATAYGWAGSVEEGISLLQTAIRRRPGDGTLLNALCWKAATWNVVTEERLATCVDAVEKSQYSAAALDSRALAHFRMGDIESARADVDAALLAEPSLTPSLFLRGLIKIEQGDEEEGRKDIALALAMNPSLEANYRAWGLEF